MARILMAWELGGGMGHLDRMLNNARALRERGHVVAFALRDLSRAHGRVAVEGFDMMQAPVWLPPMLKPPALGNYSALLAAAGWLNAPGLAALILAWQQLFTLWKPDRVICDHGPTAALSARLSVTPHWLVGNSFEVPPQAARFPPMSYWIPEHAALCAQWDALLLRHTNQALDLLGQEPLARLTDIFSSAGRAILSIPELTHYPDAAETAPVLGPSFVDDIGLPPQWPESAGPRIFVYLAPTHHDFGPLLLALRKSGACVLVHAKGVTPTQIAQLATSSIRIEPEPLHVAATLRDTDLVVSHAGIGLTSAAALAAKMQLVLPRHTEQAMVARRVEECGIGLQIPLGQKNPPFASMVKRLLEDTGFRAAAGRLAERHAGASPTRTAQAVADLVLA